MGLTIVIGPEVSSIIEASSSDSPSLPVDGVEAGLGNIRGRIFLWDVLTGECGLLLVGEVLAGEDMLFSGEGGCMERCFRLTPGNCFSELGSDGKVGEVTDGTEVDLEVFLVLFLTGETNPPDAAGFDS